MESVSENMLQPKKKQKMNKVPTGAKNLGKENNVKRNLPMEVIMDKSVEMDSERGGTQTVEETYQKKTQLEHILLRPDTYIGSTTLDTQEMWVYSNSGNKIVKKSICFSPGLYKIFDEILVNASDNKERDKKMTSIKIKIDKEKNEIKIWNDGLGIPVTIHKKEKIYVPSLIFGHLLTSSNYNDFQKKVTGGRNGFGAKLANIFSDRFTVETASKEYCKKFKQTWTNNMAHANEPEISDYSGKDFTCVTFKPDLKRFGISNFDDDLMSLFKRRAYDVACAKHGIAVYFNDEKIHVNNLKDYAKLYLRGLNDDENKDGSVPDSIIVHEIVNDRWEICVSPVDSGPMQMSFVNGIATTKGGTHVNYIWEKLINYLTPVIARRISDKKMIKPIFIKSSLFLFINSKIENPCFDSQTKENLVLNSKKFGSVCEPSEKFLKEVAKVSADAITEFINIKSKTALTKISNKSKRVVLHGIPKLDDANKAGSSESHKCTLILTEGDSAKSLAIAGLSVIGRDYYGVFPLKGKLLNIVKNAEISNLVKIVGLNFNHKYVDENQRKQLRYGKIMIMADQDDDGSHIKGLVVNFIHSYWPHLFRSGFLQTFITPLIKVFYKNNCHEFFSFPEYKEWRENTPNSHQWKVKYYKGLGTSTSAEAKKYFSSMKRHCIDFIYSGEQCDQSVKMAFAKDNVDARKHWLEAALLESKRRRQLNLPDVYLYQKNTREVTFNDFINMELVHFSNTDNKRAIPSLMDGLKPSQRKVLYTLMKRYEKKEIKVAQLAGAVSELTAYHHGEASLAATIVGLAQDFVGSNNINLLKPLGQFGSRLNGGKDAASARYIFTQLSAITRAIFPHSDDPILKEQIEDNQVVEPEWFCPIIPMVLVNGAEGIGTAYATKIPNYNPREIIDNLISMITNNSEPIPMNPWYRGFNGDVIKLSPQKYTTQGILYHLGNDKVEIPELPIRTWTQQYKEDILTPMCSQNQSSNNTEATKKQSDIKILNINEYHSDTTVRFILQLDKDTIKNYTNEYVFKQLRLESSLNLTSMVLFDQDNVLKKFESVEEIMNCFYSVRLQKYAERKAYMVEKCTANAEKLKNQARFILEVIDGSIVLQHKKKSEIITILKMRKYDSDPVKKWQQKVTPKNEEILLVNNSFTELSDDSLSKTVREVDFEYLYNMSLLHLTNEKRDALLTERDAQLAELESLKEKTIQQLWLDDLENLKLELDKFEKEISSKPEKIKLPKKHASNVKQNITPMRVNKIDYKPNLDNIKAKIVKFKEFEDKQEDAQRSTVTLDNAPVSESKKITDKEKPPPKKRAKTKTVKRKRSSSSSSSSSESSKFSDSSLERFKTEKKDSGKKTTKTFSESSSFSDFTPENDDTEKKSQTNNHEKPLIDEHNLSDSSLKNVKIPKKVPKKKRRARSKSSTSADSSPENVKTKRKVPTKKQRALSKSSTSTDSSPKNVKRKRKSPAKKKPRKPSIPSFSDPDSTDDVEIKTKSLEKKPTKSLVKQTKKSLIPSKVPQIKTKTKTKTPRKRKVNFENESDVKIISSDEDIKLKERPKRDLNKPTYKLDAGSDSSTDSELPSMDDKTFQELNESYYDDEDYM